MPAFVVSVVARDRIGLVADVTTALRDLGGNITHLSQTVVRDYFTIMLAVDVPEDATAEAIGARIRESTLPGEAQVAVMPYVAGAAPVLGPSDRFVLAILGRDRPGIIARVTRYLAEQGINIEDFTATVVSGDLVLIFGVRVPATHDIATIQHAIEQVGREFGITATLQHENVFRATSEVRAVRDLAGRH